MTSHQLGTKLAEMCAKAQNREKAVMVHLFDIRYAKELEAMRTSKAGSISHVVKAAELQPSWEVEVNKGVGLAKYVREK